MRHVPLKATAINFGRDKEGGCRYFMVFRIKEGKVDDVDLSSITAI